MEGRESISSCYPWGDSYEYYLKFIVYTESSFISPPQVRDLVCLKLQSIIHRSTQHGSRHLLRSTLLQVSKRGEGGPAILCRTSHFPHGTFQLILPGRPNEGPESSVPFSNLWCVISTLQPLKNMGASYNAWCLIIRLWFSLLMHSWTWLVVPEGMPGKPQPIAVNVLVNKPLEDQMKKELEAWLLFEGFLWTPSDTSKKSEALNFASQMSAN